MFEWNILQTTGEITQTKKKQKLKIQAEWADPRMQPYFIKEGEVIGYRDNSKSPELIEADDFQSEADAQMREEAKQKWIEEQRLRDERAKEKGKKSADAQGVVINAGF